ncbi:hypothetical protein BDA96_04G047300 [Sorghum bicolor]|uniref:Tify domain-containing protein n=3 Tax=Sorghum bicolor TaxID=4558 RepID=A0A921UJ56_SORBI|nr:hypothetical protein BDA96_04G047300 [Sorghum bicolor]
MPPILQQPAWAPPAQASSSSSPKLGSFRGVCFQVPSPTPTSDQLLAAAAGQQGRAHAVATRAPPLMQRAPCPCPCPAVGGLFLGSTSCRPPPVAAGRLIFEGSGSGSGSGSAAAARTRSSHDDSTAPMTIIYAGSVRAYGGVTLEQGCIYMPYMQAEKILAMVAKEARAAGILAEPHQLELVAAPTPTATGDDDAALMTMHYWRLAHHHVNDRPRSVVQQRRRRRCCIIITLAETTTEIRNGSSLLHK